MIALIENQEISAYLYLRILFHLFIYLINLQMEVYLCSADQYSIKQLI